MRKVFIVLLMSCVALLAIDSWADVLVYESFGDCTDGDGIDGYSGTSAESGLSGTWSLVDGGTKTFDVVSDLAVSIEGGHEPETIDNSQHLFYSGGWARATHTRLLASPIDLTADGVYYLSFFAVSDDTDDFNAQLGLYDGTNAILAGQGYSRGLNATYGDLDTAVDDGNDELSISVSDGDTVFYLVELIKTNSGSTDDLEVTICAFNLTTNSDIFHGADVARTQSFTGVSSSFDYMIFKQDGSCWMDELRICDSMESATGGISSFLPSADDMTRVILDLGTERTVEDYTFAATGATTTGWGAVDAWHGLGGGTYASSGIRDSDSSDEDSWFGEQTQTDSGFFNIADVNMVEGTTYGFTAYARTRWGAEGVNISIVAGDDPNISLATMAHGVVHDDGWQEVYVSHTATADDHGKNIGVKFEGYSDEMSNSWFRYDDVHLYENYYRMDVVGVTDNQPDGSAVLDAGTDVTLSWTQSNDPNLSGQTLVYCVSNISPDVDSYLDNPTVVELSSLESSYSIGTVTYDDWIVWRVDSIVDVNSTVAETYQGESYVVSVESQDVAPVVTAGNDWLTYVGGPMPVLTADVNDYAEGDVYDADVVWSVEVPWEPVDPTVMQMYDHTDDADLVTLEAEGYDPNLVLDWIGSDVRDDNSGYDPLVITISGLPSGEYAWTSYHHDASDQTGTFDVTVIDSTGTSTTTGIDISAGAELPVTTFTTTINSDGGDIQLQFDNTGNSNSTLFMVLNGFVLSDSVNADLAVDFGNSTTQVADGFAGYTATHEEADTFVAYSYDALGTTGITVLPEWGPAVAYGASVTVDKISGDPLAPTANFSANYSGEYTVTITATDTNGTQGAQTDSDTLVVRVAPDACTGAISWGGGSYDDSDLDNDCDVDLEDFALLAAQWLSDTTLTDSAPREE